MIHKLPYFFLFLLLITACSAPQEKQSDRAPQEGVNPPAEGPDQKSTYLQIDPGTLPELMQPGSRLMPLISAHRGGRDIPGYPENSLEVFKYIVEEIPAMLECDLNMSSDGVLLLMHDNSLDRTTTGAGLVTDQSWAELQTLKLIDDFGKITDYSIPSLEEVLRWAKGKAIMSLDVKRGVPFKNVVDLVEEYKMEDYVVIITYNVNDALSVHRLNPDLMISVSIRNQEEWLRMKNSGIPYDRMVAFTGTRLSPASLYDTLHQYGIPCILGTLGNLDRQAASRGDETTYGSFLDMGVDILATDRPLEAGRITEARKQ